MPTNIESAFVNPYKKPLGELSFTKVDKDGITYNVPALDKSWAVRDVFTNYISLVGANGRIKTDVHLEEWRHEADCFREDMNYLLSLRQHEFWSYLVYQKSALAAIVSFLQRATPFYIDITQEQTTSVEVLELYEECLSLVLRVICRLITNKESPEDWITKEHMRQLIYANYLLSVPMLFDLIVAIGDAEQQNATVLRKIFETLLQIEPNYKEDLTAALSFFVDAFRSIQTQTENEGFEGAGGGAPDDSTQTPYDDVVLYTIDCAYSLSVLLEICPQMSAVCAEMKLGHSIAHFYDSTIPFLYKNIFLINDTAHSLTVLNQARLQFLRAFRSIAYSFVEAVLVKPEESLLPSESFVGLLTECLSEQTFVIDYERKYPVALDIDILKQACSDLDDFKANFIVKGYRREAESEAYGTIGNVTHMLQTQQNSQNETELVPTTKPTYINGGDKSLALGNARDIDLEVTAVLDVLPHLGTGYVRRVLSRYDNSEDAIAAILEQNLPPDLMNVDVSEIYIPADPQDKLFEQTGIQHYNVYDGDAYDVMTQDKPDCIIKQGKGFPNAPQNAAELLDDKRDLNAIRHRYQEYSLVTEGDNEQDEYEDEYDDSYEALLESETRAIKSKELKAGLANIEDISDESDDDDDGQNSAVDIAKTETTRSVDKRMNFCENPEDMRARYEARRQQKWANRGGNNRAPASDVVGASKGQGQDKETLRNRNKKEINKSSRANHNRKAGAAFKRNKGMLA